VIFGIFEKLRGGNNQRGHKSFTYGKYLNNIIKIKIIRITLIKKSYAEKNL
jgi:hypothetical protein